MSGKTNTPVNKFSRDQFSVMTHLIACAIPSTRNRGIPIDTTSFGRMTPKVQVCDWLFNEIESLEGLSVDARHDLIELTVEELFNCGSLRFDHDHTQATINPKFQHRRRKIQHKRDVKLLVAQFQKDWDAEQAWQVHQDRAFRDRSKAKSSPVASELAPE